MDHKHLNPSSPSSPSPSSPASPSPASPSPASPNSPAYYNPRRENLRRQAVRRVLLITLLLNFAVVALKLVVGFGTGSLSLLADALHSVTDSINNVLGLVTNQLAAPDPDREHPYGHQKFEAVGALGIAAFLGIACFEILKSAGERIFQAASPVTITAFELGLLVAVLGINIFVAYYERRVGLLNDSPILIADAHHTMSDVWITLAVMGGLLGIQLWDIQWLDVALAFPVAALVLSSAWTVLKQNLPWLVDEMAIAPEVIQATVMEVPGVLNCHSIASRGVPGRKVFMEMHLVVSAPDVETAHGITEAVEAHLVKVYGPVRASLHIEPPDYVSDQVTYTGEEIAMGGAL
ncbi:MAG: cation transporter [Synechococcales cyanobacterium RM1_1_8]|nr:cation transporter [Synechococcales cyanobacterium RM1_1_8]